MRTIPSPSARRLPAAILTAALLALSTAAAAPADADVAVKPSLLAQLRAGGRVIACRHAATALAQPAARTSERVLSAAGRDQARRLGEGIRRQRIPTTLVLTSPAQRAVESARLAFGGTIRTTPALDAAANEAAQRRLFTDAVAAGGNRVLVADEAAIRRALPAYGRAALNEGDCLVLRPESGQAHVQSRIAPDDWARMRDVPHVQ